MAIHLPIGTPISSDGSATQAWLAFFRQIIDGSGLKMATQMRRLTGTRSAPKDITALGGVTPSGAWEEIQFVQGSGGAIDITANPQIAAGTSVGQTLTLVGCSGTKTLKLDNGTGLVQRSSITLVADSTISYFWDGTNWNETGRKV